MQGIGQHVIYTDEVGVKHDALVTAHWGHEDEPVGKYTVNLVYVADDASKKDQYGRQIEHASSVQAKNETAAHGRYYEVV